jgi:predicted Zn-dependent protease
MKNNGAKGLFLLTLLFLFNLADELQKAKQLEKEKRYKEASVIYQKLRREKKDDKIYARELFRLYINLKDTKSAKKELAKIPIEEWGIMAKYCEEKGLSHLAQEIYAEMAKSGLKPKTELEEIYLTEAKRLLKEGKVRSAREKIREIPQETEKKLYYLAKFFFLEEEFDSSLQYTYQLARKFPKSDLRNSLYELNLLVLSSEDLEPIIRAYRLLEADEDKEAEEVLKKSSSPFAQLLLAEIYEKSKKTDWAIKLLEKVISQDTTTLFGSKALLQLARIYQSLNDEKKAMTILEELITRFPSSPFAPIARTQLKPEKRGGVH